MELPKLIGRFVFDSITTTFKYKNNTMFSADYRNPSNNVKMTIFTFYDDELEKQTFGIKIKGSMVRGIISLDKALQIASELIEQNDSFLADN